MIHPAGELWGDPWSGLERAKESAFTLEQGGVPDTPS